MNQTFFGEKDYVSLQEASRWASGFLERKVTVSNISYLIQYGRVKKYGNTGTPLVRISELKNYYKYQRLENRWRDALGEDLNWRLSFSDYRESERTKHVHRLHPYKGKFIPQLVEYFLDSHVDEFKRDVYFEPGDIVLDPFCGSGTTLVQANELGINAIGVDVSSFNAMISNTKTGQHDFSVLRHEIEKLTTALLDFQGSRNNAEFEEKLLEELGRFNAAYFPSPEYKMKIRNGEIDEKKYAYQKAREFLPIYHTLVEEFDMSVEQEKKNSSFLDTWFLAPVREEIDFLFEQIRAIPNVDVKKVLAVVLSRTVRSCRATTHADLGTLKSPVTATYYCRKHSKICKPIFTIRNWWKTYSQDTLKRLRQFARLRTDTQQICLAGDSRNIDIIQNLSRKKPNFAELVGRQKIKGIFSSPPYVGLIDYHEQHAYAYDILGFERKDELEIGPLYKGQGKQARDSYVMGISDVLINCRRFLQDDFDVFLVANDKSGLYPQIAKLSGLRIVNQFKRPVLNRVEKNRAAYAETIFHLKGE